MKVLHVVPSTPFGGLQKIAALLAAEQRRIGLDVHVLGLYEGAKLLDLLRHYELPHTFLRGSGPHLSAFRQFGKVLSENWSIVHIHGGLLWSNTMALVGKRSLVVYHAHNYPTSDCSVKYQVLNRINRALVDVVIAVSQDVARAWRVSGIGSTVECVYNAVELPRMARAERSSRLPLSPVFGMTTRLTRDKGIFEFLDVAEVIHARRRVARFIIAGEGPERAQLEHGIENRGLGDVFELPGYVRDLDAFWSGVDVALFTAQKEPFGLRILEPMARGIPVATYLSGAGSDEIVCSGQTASTAPYPDSEMLAEAALRICDDPQIHAQITSAAIMDVATRFSLPSMSQAVVRIYTSNLGFA